VDGLAVSFLLSNPDQLNYDRFYDAVISLSSAGSRRDQLLGSNWSSFDAAAVQYHMTVCWRLLACLPPSAAFMKRLEMSSHPPRLSDGPMLLHAIRWVPRLPHKAFQVCGDTFCDSIEYYSTLCPEKTSAFCFWSNFVKMFCTEIIFGAHIPQ